MKFGLYSSIASPPRGEHIARCIDEVIAEAQLAESCGFELGAGGRLRLQRSPYNTRRP